ncbi:MAG: DUF456 domain-containing protein [Bacteroidia bacterium]
MEIAIIVVGVILILIGFAGSILPALPGPPLAFASLLLLFFIDHTKASMADGSYTWLIILGVVTVFITVIDFYMPVWGTKKFGGTKAGSRGSTIGLIVAAILTFTTAGLGAFTILLGPLVGAYIGEKNSGQTHEVALQSAKGSFLGFIAGTFMKVVTVVAIAIYFASLIL